MKREYDDVEVVESMQYCVKSKHQENVDRMNEEMGYHNMKDKANNGKYPSRMEGAKRNTQVME